MTRTLAIKQLVPLSAYHDMLAGVKRDPSRSELVQKVQVIREYEADLPMEEQVTAIIEAVQFVPERQMEVTTRVELAAKGAPL